MASPIKSCFFDKLKNVEENITSTKEQILLEIFSVKSEGCAAAAIYLDDSHKTNQPNKNF